jgi:hypothetical protein
MREHGSPLSPLHAEAKSQNRKETPTMVTVILRDLSAYDDCVVYAEDAPVYDRIRVADFAAAFDVAIEYGDDFQVTFES